MPATPSTATNVQKTYLGRTLNRFAERKVRTLMYLYGKSLPAEVTAVDPTGTIVTVKFLVQGVFTLPAVTMPVTGFEYIRYPIQVGCLGKVEPADTYIGNVTGLGSSALPKIDVLPANLSALCFKGLGNKNHSATDDPQAVVIYGPNGVIIRDTAKNCVFTLTPTGIVISGPVGDLDVSGNLSAGNGWTGSFSTPTGQTVMVQNGIVTNVY